MILFSEDEIILAIRCYVQVVFPATPCHLMTLWKWKQQPVTRWLDSYITQNNKKDGTQPHDDDNVVVDARLLAPVMWRHRDKMANETNDFSTPHVGTSSYDFIALGSILKPLRRPATHSSLNAIYLVAKMREGFLWSFYHRVSKAFFGISGIQCIQNTFWRLQ